MKRITRFQLKRWLFNGFSWLVLSGALFYVGMVVYAAIHFATKYW